MNIEKKRVRGVKDTLAKSEVLWKLQRTETVINKLKKKEKRFDAVMTPTSEMFPEK